MSRPLLIRLTFTPVVGASADQIPGTNGRYVAIQEADGVLVTDQQTGQSTVETMAGQGGACHTYATGFAGPWLVGGCITASENYVEQLYSFATGTWRTINLPDGCVWQGGSGYSGASECDVGPVGTDWLGWTETCWNCGSYSGLVYLGSGLQPIFSVPSTSPTTVLDYNSPTLTARLCAPLRNTPSNRLILNSSGQFVYSQAPLSAPLGRFAVAYGRANRFGVSKAYLERCGSVVRRPLAGYPITSNASELLFDQDEGATLTGIFLPSLRRFVIHVPHALLSPTNGRQREFLAVAGLSSRTLYIIDPSGELWQAPAPHDPTPNR